MRRTVVAGAAAVAVLGAVASASAGRAPALRVGPPQLLPGTAGVSEPRIAVDPRTDVRYAVANLGSGDAKVFASRDGRGFRPVAGDIPGQVAPTIDLDVVVLPSGRLIANELDTTFTFATGYSDDGGRTWTASRGIPHDVDRQWLAAGPRGQVYLVYHNFVSGLTPLHEVLVQTSTDGGATFGVPVPVALPTEQEALDLGCGDSTGPSGIAVDQRTGRIYVAVATRTSAVAGGCGKTVLEQPGFNVVPSNRVWVATSPDGSLGSWTTSLAVDTSKTGEYVALQYASIAVDRSGIVYLAYTQSVRPGDYTSAVRYRTAPAGLGTWSRPVEVPGTRGGSLFAHVVAGDRGRIALSWLAARRDGQVLWFPQLAVTTDALGRSPSFSRAQLSRFPSHVGTPSAMSAACGSGPLAGIQQGLTCGRFLDNYGMAVDRRGHAMVIWPAVAAAQGDATAGTYVVTQTGGPLLRR
jgi:hypothetical protein